MYVCSRQRGRRGACGGRVRDRRQSDAGNRRTDAIHADNALTIGAAESSAGSPAIQITDSYEGLEGTTVTIYSGDIDVTASDDGVNAANSDIGERSDLFAINIYGGDLYVNAGSDGLDSNCDITHDRRHGRGLRRGSGHGHGHRLWTALFHAFRRHAVWRGYDPVRRHAGLCGVWQHAVRRHGRRPSRGMGGMDGTEPPEGADGAMPERPDGETMPDRGPGMRPDEGSDLTPPDGTQPDDSMTPPDDSGEHTRPDGMGGMQGGERARYQRGQHGCHPVRRRRNTV